MEKLFTISIWTYAGAQILLLISSHAYSWHPRNELSIEPPRPVKIFDLICNILTGIALLIILTVGLCLPRSH